MLNCPKCIGKLEEKQVEGIKVDICWVCEGIWFDKGELDKVLEADSKDFNNIDVDRGQLDGKEVAAMQAELDTKPGICPRCQGKTALERIDYEGKAYVDICKKCEGLWLDAGEIHTLRKRAMVKIADTLYVMKETVVEGILNVFRKKKSQSSLGNDSHRGRVND